VSLLYKSLFSDQVVQDPEFDHAELRADFSRRVANGIPPGTKDTNKDDEGIGDFIIWRTILAVGKSEKKAILFVSADQKADWWHQSERGPLYPRFELVDEYRRHSDGRSFHMMTFSAFLEVMGASKTQVDEVRKEELELRAKASGSEQPVTADAVADFSISANPFGSWSYGWSNGPEGQFVLHTSRQIEIFPGVDRWASPQIEPNMGVMHNRTGEVISGNPPTYTIPPDMLHMHPGAGGIYDIVRWTCPRSGQFKIQGQFSGLDAQTFNADSDVDVVINSRTSLFSSKAPTMARVLHGTGTQVPIAFTDIRLSAGDTVDFTVGVGPSGSHFNDSTGLQARISQTGD
jgi:hypothetical protein